MQKLIPRPAAPGCTTLVQREAGRQLLHSIQAQPKQIRRQSTKQLLALAALAVGLAGTAMAGEHLYNFNPPGGDPTAAAGFLLFGNNAANAWQTNGGASGAPGDGFLQITPSANSTTLGVLFPLDYYTNADSSLVALPLKGFLLEADVRIGNPIGNNGRPADGFSISFAHNDDPVVFWGKQGNFRGWAGGDSVTEALEPTTYNFATGVGTFDYNQCGSGTAENGTKTGVAVQFDTWQGNTVVDSSGSATGGNDCVGWRVHYNGKELHRVLAQPPTGPLPSSATPDPTGADVNGLAVCPALDATFTQDPACTPNACVDTNSIETGVYTSDSGGANSNLCWTHFSIELTTNTPHLLTVIFKGRTIIDHVTITNFQPYVGQIVMGGRTGGANENRDVDNVHVITYPSVQATLGGISTVSSYAADFTIAINNIGPAKVTSIGPVTLDAVDVTSSANSHITIGDPSSFFTYRVTSPASFFVPGSAHKINITYTDALNNVISTPLSFTVGNWSSLANASVPAASVDLTKPGFLVRTYQTTLGPITRQGTTELRRMEDSVRRSEEQLAGLLGPNFSGISNTIFIETNVINYTIRTATAQGDYNFNTDTNNSSRYAMSDFPGIADVTTGDPTTDNMAAEVDGVLNFPEAGYYNITVASDDGFHLWFGNPPNDVFHSLHVSEFDGGRGNSDSTVTLYVPTNGFYPYRLVYENGGGDASLEFIATETYPTVDTNFIRVGNLVNDGTMADSIKSYQSSSAPVPAAVTFITPVPAHGTYEANAHIAANITDGSDGAISASSVKLWVNGTSVSPTITKNGNVTSLSYTPPVASPYPNGSNWLAIAFTDHSGNGQTNLVPFNTRGYTLVPASMALPASVVNKAKGGFNLYGYQSHPHGPGDTNTSNGNMPNSVFRTEIEQHGYLGWPNVLDLTSFTGPGGTYVESTNDNIGGVINYNGFSGNAGNFNDPFAPFNPGIPSTDTTIAPSDGFNVDNLSYDIQSVLDLQPGLYRIGFNSDDGFALTFGNPLEWKTLKLLVVQADFGKGASDVTGYIYITQAGLYPVRVAYENGQGGGQNLEFYLQHAWPDRNWHVPVNDQVASYTNFDGSANFPTINSYQYPIGATKGSPYISSYKPAADKGPSGESIHASTHTGTDSPVKVTLEDGEGTITTASVKLWVDGASVSPTISKNLTTTTVSYPAPAAGWTPNTNHTVQLSFLDRTVNWTFQVENHPTATFFIEAEDFNYGGGQTQAAASAMPYIGGAYAGLSAVHGVDYFRSGNDNHGAWYRLFPNSGQVPVPFQMNHDLDRGVNEVWSNERIGWIGASQWYNYTRTFPAGKYNVYAGLSQGNTAGTSPHARYAVLQMVDSPTAPTVTNSLGIFDDVATGAYGQNGGVGQAGGVGLVPMTDGSGNTVSINLSGTQTLRAYFPSSSTNETVTINGTAVHTQPGSGDFDFLMFVPATAPTGATVSVSLVGGKVTITFTGTLQSSTTVNGTYSAVAGATNPYTVPSGSGPTMFFRAHQ